MESYKTAGITEKLRRYHIPYNHHIKVTPIGEGAYTVVEDPEDVLYWVGSGNYCRKVTWVGSDAACEVDGLIWVPEEETSYCEQTP